jgi:calcineurin-like phosphoesterase family protein
MSGFRLLFRSAVLPAVVLCCSRDESPTKIPEGAQPTELALAGAAVMLGVGDIAVCGRGGDEAAARIVDSVLVADSAAGLPGVVATFGDNAYPSGSVNDFKRCFSPSWGSSRIMKVIHPSPGNHEYGTGSTDAYFEFFGNRAGPPGKGYYSYDVGEWHVISLNSELYYGYGSPSQAKEQEDWLRRDLRDNRKLCTMAYFHRPLFSSGRHGGSPSMRALWTIFYGAGADLIVNGHEHHYERFRPQTPEGIADSARGIVEIIAGTGGGILRGMRYPLLKNSVTQIHGYYGVLKLTLGPGEYRHAFISTSGRVWDTGSGRCH